MIVREQDGSRDACSLDIRTNEGFARIFSSKTVAALSDGKEPCDGIVDIAKAIEPSIEKGR